MKREVVKMIAHPISPKVMIQMENIVLRRKIQTSLQLGLLELL